ncbi:hypothetical protein [Bifidobacterium crudilactis]|jgi:uncharacterized protein YfcZ (UPF0381/DUF406 family)|uniref:hypothetical protein n=1 Tax=Bifidobacterium crudilactis TaxID=327277 RepID=UPI0023552656|nr:hypothetical protein [Bifidobacterium crudilactis]MCI2148833.1 hypothetical protein [Bifidobacterium crudilactis]MCI2158301.1 hypothetical protein [Bifidobacterium crudilactis]
MKYQLRIQSQGDRESRFNLFGSKKEDMEQVLADLENGALRKSAVEIAISVEGYEDAHRLFVYPANALYWQVFSQDPKTMSWLV